MAGPRRKKVVATAPTPASSSSPKEGSPGLLPDAIVFTNVLHVCAGSVTKANGQVVLWDVDTQVDFMLPDGKLYVPGAEETITEMQRLVEAARAAGVVHVASADDHELTDPEISVEPDFQNTYPPHCLRGTRGAQKIPETEQANPFPLSLVPYPPGLVPSLVAEHREVLILKKNFNVFTNPNTEPLLDALDPAEIVVFGVATDVCNDAAIRGFLQRGRRVRFVEDAARGLDEERVTTCTTAWREAGVEFTTTDAVVSSFG